MGYVTLIFECHKEYLVNYRTVGRRNYGSHLHNKHLKAFFSLNNSGNVNDFLGFINLYFTWLNNLYNESLPQGPGYIFWKIMWTTSCMLKLIQYKKYVSIDVWAKKWFLFFNYNLKQILKVGFIRTIIASKLTAPELLSVQPANYRRRHSTQISRLPGWEDTKFFSVYLWQIHTIHCVHESSNQW